MSIIHRICICNRCTSVLSVRWQWGEGPCLRMFDLQRFSSPGLCCSCLLSLHIRNVNNQPRELQQITWLICHVMSTEPHLRPSPQCHWYPGVSTDLADGKQNEFIEQRNQIQRFVWTLRWFNDDNQVQHSANKDNIPTMTTWMLMMTISRPWWHQGPA